MERDELIKQLEAADPVDDVVFRSLVATALRAMPAITNQEIGETFDVSRPSAQRWREGRSLPHPAMRPHIYRWFIAKAKELLKKAGLPNGFAAELWTLPVARPYNPNGKKMGELMQSDLAKIGIVNKNSELFR